MLSIRGLSKTYRDSWGRHRVEALRDVTLDIERGEILGLLGPNGSGKTTFVKALLGLVRPTAGTATIGGEPSGSVAARRLCGYLPEESTFPLGFTPRELLLLFGEVVALPRPERAAQTDRLLDVLDLRQFAARPIRKLSRGTLRRVGLALSLLGDPSVLLLDEPTSGMDPLAAAIVRDELRRRSAAGTTIVLSTHLASDVEGLCGRVAILAEGRLLATETVDRLLSRDGVLRILAGGLEPGGVEAVSQAIAREGGAVLEIGPARESLDRVFEQVLRREPPSDRAVRRP